MNSDVLSNYVFGETYFPHMAMPINIESGNTILFFESKQIIWKIEKQLKDKKKIANNLNVNSLMAMMLLWQLTRKRARKQARSLN